MNQLDQLDVFISYARMDGAQFAARFHRDLQAHPSHRFSVWYDGLITSQDWDRIIEQKVAAADVFLAVLTRGSPDRDWCRDEIALARLHNVAIFVLKMHDDVVVDQLALVRKPVIDYATLGEEAAWTDLLRRLEAEAAPERVQESIDAALADDVQRGADSRQKQSRRDRLERRQQEQQRTTGARAPSGEATGPEPAGSAPAPTSMRFVNELPTVAQTEFRDHVPALQRVDEALRDPGVRLIVLTGPDGAGKTAMVGEVRKRLADGQFATRMAGFAYLAGGGYRPVSAGTVLLDLARLVPDDEKAVELGRLLRRDARLTAKIDAVLDVLGPTPVVMAIDDADELLDKAGRFRDHELRVIVRELVRRENHGVRFLLVTDRNPRGLAREHGQHLRMCPIDGGLPEKETRPFLAALDTAQVLQLHAIPEDQLVRLSVVSDGNPRFLELIYCLLRVDPRPPLTAVLDDITRPGMTAIEATAALLQHIVGSLDRTQRRVAQGLAVYGRPVPAEAVDYLLEEYVVDVRSAPILHRLLEQRLVRRDADRYFLPPHPDAELIRSTILAGTADDWDRDPKPYTLPFLRHRAADYFAAKRAERIAVTSLDDLRLEFSEIELRIAAGGIPAAIELMEQVDNDYLTRWGLSGALEEWRRQIRRDLPAGRLAAHNLSYLAAGLDGGDDDETADIASALAVAIHQPWARRAPRGRLQLTIQLALAEREAGRLTAAARRLRTAAWLCRFKSMSYEEALGRDGLALCLAQLGRFRAATRQFSRAARLVRALDGPQRDEVDGTICLNWGWLYGQFGDADRALDLLDNGLRVATAAHDIVLEGRLLDGQAAVLSDYRDPQLAVAPAERAAEIGVRTPNVNLSRQANVTLAYAYLRTNQIAQAAAAAQAAVRLPPGPRALAAWAAYGTALFRAGDDAGARDAFYAACTEAWLRIDREPGAYQTYEVAGLALSGLAVCGEPSRLSRAVDAYRRARRIAPVAGASRRCAIHLRLLGSEADPEVINTALRAATGEDQTLTR